MSHSPSPLQIATKIHFFLLRELGQGIDVERMLKQSRYAREVLQVCDACVGTELADLADQFRRVQALYRRLDRMDAEHAAQGGAEWSRATTGFGVSRPMEDTLPPPAGDSLPAPLPAAVGTEAQRGWLPRWLQRQS